MNKVSLLSSKYNLCNHQRTFVPHEIPSVEQDPLITFPNPLPCEFAPNLPLPTGSG